ncbi:MAG: isoaspartyl peptidase/L-asparaginase, partial [Rubricoccaceae bacterium]
MSAPGAVSAPGAARAWSGVLPRAEGPAVLVHGGAWDIPDDEADAHREGLLRALARAECLLGRRAPAVEVAAEAVAVLEADPAFDAGRGAVLDRDGFVQLDAGLMDGHTRAWGAVANVRCLPHPVRIARRLLEGDAQARLLVAEGAERYAAEHGFPHVAPEHLVVPRERARHARLLREAGFHTSRAFTGPVSGPQGTVGCVVRDA